MGRRRPAVPAGRGSARLSRLPEAGGLRFQEEAHGQLLTLTLLPGRPIVAWAPDGEAAWLGKAAGGQLAAVTSVGADSEQVRLEMFEVVQRHAAEIIRSFEVLLGPER